MTSSSTTATESATASPSPSVEIITSSTVSEIAVETNVIQLVPAPSASPSAIFGALSADQQQQAEDDVTSIQDNAQNTISDAKTGAENTLNNAANGVQNLFNSTVNDAKKTVVSDAPKISFTAALMVYFFVLVVL
jgi:hypothetical protein